MAGERELHDMLASIPKNATFQGRYPDGFYYYSTPDGAHVPIISGTTSSQFPGTEVGLLNTASDEINISAKGSAGIELAKQLLQAQQPREVFERIDYLEPEMPFFSSDPGQQQYEEYLWRLGEHPLQVQPPMAVIEAPVEHTPIEQSPVVVEATQSVSQQSEPSPLQQAASEPVESEQSRAHSEAKERKTKIIGRFRNVGIVAVLMAVATGPSVHSYENGSIALEACDLDSFAETFNGWDKAGCYAGQVAVSSVMSIPNPLP